MIGTIQKRHHVLLKIAPTIVMIQSFRLRVFMFSWCLKQSLGIVVRYFVAVLIALIVGGVVHLFVIDTVSHSMFVKVMPMNMLILMIPSVMVWHVFTQLALLIRPPSQHIQVTSSLLSAILVLFVTLVGVPELHDVPMLDLALFIGIYLLAALLCGVAMKMLITKDWKLCALIAT